MGTFVKGALRFVSGFLLFMGTVIAILSVFEPYLRWHGYAAGAIQLLCSIALIVFAENVFGKS